MGVLAGVLWMLAVLCMACGEGPSASFEDTTLENRMLGQWVADGDQERRAYTFGTYKVNPNVA